MRHESLLVIDNQPRSAVLTTAIDHFATPKGDKPSAATKPDSPALSLREDWQRPSVMSAIWVLCEKRDVRGRSSPTVVPKLFDSFEYAWSVAVL